MKSFRQLMTAAIFAARGRHASCAIAAQCVLRPDTRAVLPQVNAAFIKHWQGKSGQTVRSVNRTAVPGHRRAP